MYVDCDVEFANVKLFIFVKYFECGGEISDADDLELDTDDEDLVRVCDITALDRIPHG